MENIVDIWKSLSTIHDHFLVPASAAAAKGEIEAKITLIQLDGNGAPEKAMDLPQGMVNMFFSGEEGKSLYSAYLQNVFKEADRLRGSMVLGAEFRPDVVVQVGEAWMVVADKAGELDQGVAPSKHPQRIECLLVTLHTEFGSVPVAHPIVKDPNRRVDRKPFPELEENLMEQYRGRLTVQADPATRSRPKH